MSFLLFGNMRNFSGFMISFVENEDYAGYIIPPAPPRPNSDASREKLQKLGEGSTAKEEFTKMKQILEAEYLVIFNKTVAMPEVSCAMWQHVLF